MASDYGKWFISKDGTVTIKCKREKFMDAPVDLIGSTRAAQTYTEFRKATFSESCRLELELTEG